MKRDPRFFAGLAGVGLVLTFLVWTGINDTMVYYLTPSELVERVSQEDSLHDVGFKVSGQVVPGSHEEEEGELLHRFVVRDLEGGDVEIPVEFRHPLPDTFDDDEDTEVVMEGRYGTDGVFQASEVLTKCGSRYEAVPGEEEAEGYGSDADRHPVEGSGSGDSDPGGEESP